METFNENEDKILFWGGGFGCFSNFSVYSIVYDGKIWPSTEHAYQATKFNDEQIKNKILKAKSALEAFTIGRSFEEMFLRKDWYEIRIKIMEDIVREKIKQYPDIYEMLIKTGDKEIIEASPLDSFWGWGPDKNGENNMGKIWMKLRLEIMNKTQ